MFLHEYQAKALLADYALPLPKGGVALSGEEARAIAQALPGDGYYVKAQIHAGARARAGGIRWAQSPDQVAEMAEALLHRPLVTSQTGPRGEVVRKVLVEEAIAIAHEYYIAIVLDHAEAKLVALGAKSGGRGIDLRARQGSGELVRQILGWPAPIGADDFSSFANGLGLKGQEAQSVAEMMANLARGFVERDASLIEINPLARTGDGRFVVVDAKIALDDNAQFRQPEAVPLGEAGALGPVELEAARHEINFIEMTGNIGVVVNGAGLALATLDMLCDAGGRPANFMDIRPVATSLQMARGIALVLENPSVEALLVNIHGGGLTRCDTVAEGLGIALARSGRRLPIVLRFAGNHADFAHTVLGNCGVDYTNAPDMAAAVAEVVRIAKGEAAA